MIEAKKIFSGQKSRYGDYFHEYDITITPIKDGFRFTICLPYAD